MTDVTELLAGWRKLADSVDGWADYLPATVLREGWGDRATPSPDRGAA